MQLIKNEELTYLGKRINLDISEISYGFLDTEWNMQNLCAAFTRVYLPLEGEGILTIGDTAVTIVPGNIYVVPSNLNFSGYCPKMLNKIYIHLTLSRPDGIDVFSGIDRCLILENQWKTVIEISNLYTQHNFQSVLKLKLMLYEILEQALSLHPHAPYPVKNYSNLTKAALAYIDTHLSASLTIGEIASALFVSKLVLQKHFREDLDKPIGKYIDQCLMSRAERDLLDQTLSIKEISDRLGFCDQFYFSRKFSDTHGISPRRFRQLHIV